MASLEPRAKTGEGTGAWLEMYALLHGNVMLDQFLTKLSDCAIPNNATLTVILVTLGT